MTDDRTLRQVLEDTQARLARAHAKVEDLESRHWLASLRAQSQTERADQLEKEAASLRAQLASTARGTLDERASTMQTQLGHLMQRLKYLDQELPPTATRLDVCARCGSTKVIPGASIKDSTDFSVAALVFRDPHGIHRNPQRVELMTLLCGSCGHAEVFGINPEKLYSAYLEYKLNVKKP